MTTNATELLPDPAAHVPPGFLAWVGELVHQHRAQLLAYARRRGLGAEDALNRRRKQQRRVRAELLLESSQLGETECSELLVARAEELARIKKESTHVGQNPSHGGARHRAADSSRAVRRRQF